MENKQFAYQQRKVNPTTIWLLFLLFGWSYGSLRQIGWQILYYLTAGGLFVWAFIRLFTLQGAIKDYNRKIAQELGFTKEEIIQMGLV